MSVAWSPRRRQASPAPLNLGRLPRWCFLSHRLPGPSYRQRPPPSRPPPLPLCTWALLGSAAAPMPLFRNSETSIGLVEWPRAAAAAADLSAADSATLPPSIAIWGRREGKVGGKGGGERWGPREAAAHPCHTNNRPTHPQKHAVRLLRHMRLLPNVPSSRCTAATPRARPRPCTALPCPRSAPPRAYPWGPLAWGGKEKAP